MNDGPMFEYGLKAMAGQLIRFPTRAQDYPDKDRLAERFSQFVDRGGGYSCWLEGRRAGDAYPVSSRLAAWCSRDVVSAT
jgi:hypothetical protein